MHWYKIETDKGKDGTYNYIGSSEEKLDVLVKLAQDGIFIRLDNLLYTDRGEIKKWADWDKNLNPSVRINPAVIVSIMQFKKEPKSK